QRPRRYVARSVRTMLRHWGAALPPSRARLAAARGGGRRAVPLPHLVAERRRLGPRGSPRRGPVLGGVTAASRVDLVGILFIVWGILTTLIGVSTLALAVGAISLITSASRVGELQVAAGLTAAAFTTLAFIALIWGIGHIAVGLHLRRLDARARLGALM